MRTRKKLFTLMLSLMLAVSMLPANLIAYAVDDASGADAAASEIVTADENGEAGDSVDAAEEDVSPDNDQEDVDGSGDVSDGGRDAEGDADGSGAVVEPEVSDEAEAAEDAEEELPESSAEYVVKDDTEAVDVQGKAAEKQSVAADVLSKETELSSKEAKAVSKQLFASANGGGNLVPGYERQLDGSNIEDINIKWITEDTVDNGDEDLLYVRPADDAVQSVRLQFEYSLSGEHNYEPGDITITIPAYIFKDRNGNDYGTMIIPFPENPSTENDFNWTLVGDHYVLTNTQKMSAATKGFIQFTIGNMLPHQLVDMEVSSGFDATITVQTHKGNTIALRSDTLTAQFDTEAKVTDAKKKVYSAPSVVKASKIPESQRIAGEDYYVTITWYVWGTTSSNTMYTLDITDRLGTVKDDQGNTFTGFVVDDGKCAVSEDGQSAVRDDEVHGYKTGQTSFYYFTTAYPLSQFSKDTYYYFHNDVDFEVTEDDPDAEVTNPNVQETDPQLVTTKTAGADTKWYYREPEWIGGKGPFKLYKNGNDDTKGKNLTHRNVTQETYTTRSDQHLNSRYWYGIYPYGINEIVDEGETRVSYTINSVADVRSYMFDSSSKETYGELAERISINYNKPVTIVTTDTGLNYEFETTKMQVGTDYEYEAIEFAGTPYIWKSSPTNVNPDGTWKDLNGADGQFVNTRDNDPENIPDIRLDVLVDGEWLEGYATASWKTGELVVTFADGTTQKSKEVKVPSGTENFRTVVTMENTETDQSKNTVLQAKIDYDVRPIIKLKATYEMISRINEEFQMSNTPFINIYNGGLMTLSKYDGTIIGSSAMTGYDSVRGYTVDTTVYPYKESTFDVDDDVYYASGMLTVHYKAKVEERSVINNKQTYEQALADGKIKSETHCTWYDLLPVGMSPDLNSIRLRTNDQIVSKKTIEDYNGSGRTLLIVEADLEPVPVEYTEGDSSYFEDVPEIAFDALYSIDSLTDYGDNVHNVIAFESGNTELGTVDDYKGEPDDPFVNNNIATKEAFEDDTEKAVMKDLDKSADDPNFAYAGCYTKLDSTSAARTSLQKHVMVNNDGWWSTGVYLKQSDASTAARTVYTGGQYTYRLRMMSNTSTISKDLIIYDSLENFVPADGNADIDIDAPQWQGTFRSVDVRQLIDKGCDPVVYYSTVSNLKLSDESDPTVVKELNTDLTDTSIWVRADQYDGDPADVKAIAVDARKAADGGDFTLAAQDSIAILVNMKAPSGEEAVEYTKREGAWGESAQAYNNAFMKATSINEETGESNEAYVRKDYTKVGIKPYEIEVDKTWDDDDDRDGARPEEITFRLYANGTEIDSATVKATTDEDGNITWHHVFTDLLYTDDDGEKITYSVKEDPVPGYTTTFTEKNANTAFFFTNKHVPERTSVSGSKRWVGDTPDSRPAYIYVQLFKNGEFFRQQYVKADSNGNWTYSFDDLYKYEDGKEIEYTVKEKITSTAGKSYVVTVEDTDEGYDIVNEYNPYGDLYLEKKTEDVTPASKDKEFEFEFEFTRQEKNGTVTETIPVFNEYDYVITDTSDDSEVGTGKISTGETVKLKGGQKIHIINIDEYVYYKITEADADGFTMTEASNAQGQIKPNTYVEASFNNEYSASGMTELKAVKTLENKELRAYQFAFEVYKVDENGKETLVRSSANERPSSSDTPTGDGAVVSTAPVYFGAFGYTSDDLRGSDGEPEAEKTFIYRIKEKITGSSGYTYDDTVYTAKVVVKDNGDGTLKCVRTYYKGESTAEEDKIEVEALPFVNKYESHGSTVLKAWKALDGREIEAGEFTFELLDGNGDPVLDDNGKPVQAVNDENGIVTFPEISYDQGDDGKTFKYIVKEIPGDDDTVIYSSESYLYTITVEDNGDGTMFVDQSVKKIKDADGKDVDDDADDTVPVITNPLRPGSLSLTKITQNGDTDQDFKFKVKLIGDDIPETLDVVIDKVENKVPDETGTEESGQNDGDNSVAVNTESANATAPGLIERVTSALSPLIANAEEGSSKIYHATEDELRGNAYAVLRYDDGGLIFFRSTKTYTGDEEIYTDLNGSAYEGTLYKDFEDVLSGNAPWIDDLTAMSNVKYVEIARGQAIKPTYSTAYWFAGMGNMQSCDLSRLDTSIATDMHNMFENCTGLQSLNLSNLDTSNVIHMEYMFSGCSNLASLDVSGWDTSSVEQMGSVFSSCENLSSLDVSGWDTSQVTDMGSMFYECKVLSSLDVSGWDTSKVTNMKSMFSGCIGFSSLDLSGFDTSKVKSFSGMFSGCTNLKTLDISGFDTRSQLSQIGDHNMFEDDNALSKVSLGPNWEFEYSILPDPSTEENYTGKWILTDDDERQIGAKTARELKDGYFRNSRTWAGTWVWETKSFTLKFDGDGAAGSMKPMKMLVASNNVIPANRFVKYGYKFAGWEYTAEDGTVYTYENQSTIPKNTFEMGQVVTLKALWEKIDGSVEVVDGEFEIVLHGGEKATIDDLPAGTAYQIYEDTPSGWVLIEQSGESGTIKPADTSEAWFVNDYRPGSTFITLNAVKMMDEKTADADSFEFRLINTNSGKVIEKVKVKAGGMVRFSPIEYTAAGTYTYRIQEIAGNDSTVNYDANEVKVTVTVRDDGTGNLIAEAVYTGNTTFTNTTKPGDLKITKSGSPITSANENDEFTFDVTLTDQAGKPYTDPVTWQYDGDSRSNTETPVNGRISLKCKAGQSIIINDLPAGTRYDVSETDIPSGWSNVSIEGSSGVIKSNEICTVKAKNEYDAEGHVRLLVYKEAEGFDLKEGQFTFELWNEDPESSTADPAVNLLETRTNAAPDASGKYKGLGLVSFSNINYDTDDIGQTFSYYIREVQGDDPSVSYSSDVISVEVEVYDAGGGMLGTTVIYDGSEAEYDDDGVLLKAPTIVNPVNTDGKLRITKATDGTGDPDAEFEFTVVLSDESGSELTGSFEYDVYSGGQDDPARTGNVSSGGTVKLKAGETAEIIGLPIGTSYSVTETEKTGWTLESVQNDTGVITGSGDTDVVTASFTNTYSAEGEVVFTAAKTLENKSLKNAMFTFILYDEALNEIGRAVNDGDGVIKFDPITYTMEDMKDAAGNAVTEKAFEYTIAEDLAGEDGIVYDTTSHKVIVTVKDDGSGKLSTELDYRGGAASFNNRYEPEGSTVIPVTKVLKGRKWKDSDAFTFTLKSVDGAPMPAGTEDGKTSKEVTVTKDSKDYTESFGEISFTVDDMKDAEGKFVKQKTFTYEITEVIPENKSNYLFYDENTYIATVTVTDDDEGHLQTAATYSIKTEDGGGGDAAAGSEEPVTGDNGELVITNEYKATELKLTKTLDGFVDTGTRMNVTTAFRIVGTDSTGAVVYENYVGITFAKDDAVDEDGRYTKTVTVTDIPLNADIKVYEVDPDNYTSDAGAESGKEAEYDADANIWTVTVNNTHKEVKPKSGVVNKYSDGELKDQEGLIDGPEPVE